MVKKKINLKDITIIIPAKIIEKNLINCVDVCKKKYPDTPVIIVLDYLDKKKSLLQRKNIKFNPKTYVSRLHIKSDCASLFLFKFCLCLRFYF